MSGSAPAASTVTMIRSPARSSRSVVWSTARPIARSGSGSSRISRVSGRSGTATGSSSPAIATPRVCPNRAALVGNASYSVRSPTPASAATSFMCVPVYPDSVNSRAAASLMRARVAAASARLAER